MDAGPELGTAAELGWAFHPPSISSHSAPNSPECLVPPRPACSHSPPRWRHAASSPAPQLASFLLPGWAGRQMWLGQPLVWPLMGHFPRLALQAVTRDHPSPSLGSASDSQLHGRQRPLPGVFVMFRSEICCEPGEKSLVQYSHVRVDEGMQLGVVLCMNCLLWMGPGLRALKLALTGSQPPRRQRHSHKAWPGATLSHTLFLNIPGSTEPSSLQDPP